MQPLLGHGAFPTELKQVRVLPLFKNLCWIPLRSVPTVPSPTFNTFPNLLNVLSSAASLNILPLTICCRCSNQPIDHSTWLKQLCPSTTTLSTPSTMAKYLFLSSSCLLASLITSCSCQYLLANQFSIDSLVLSWFQSYLTDWTQTFTYKGGKTSSFSVDCSVPQGLVLGPHCFVSYTKVIADLLQQHAIQSHMYADDIQFHNSCRPDDTDMLHSCLLCCADSIYSWQLNVNKTIWVGSQYNLAKIANSDCSVQIDSSNIQTATVVYNLGLDLDCELSMKHHVAEVAGIATTTSDASARFDKTWARRSQLSWCMQR